MLQSQVFSHAKYLYKKVPNNVILSVAGTAAVANAVHKRDFLQIVNNVQWVIITLLNMKKEQNESFCNFGSRFKAHVSNPSTPSNF